MKTAVTSLLIVGIFFSLAPTGASAADVLDIPSRDVTLEWDDIQGAASYEVEVTRKNTGKGTGEAPKLVKSLSTVWNGKLVPGFYQMRIRAKDRRQVPGDWSEAVDLTVLLDPPTSQGLKKELRVVAKSADKTNYNFAWAAVPGADAYELKVTSETGQVLHSVTVKELSQSLQIPVAQKLKWSLVATNSEGLASEAPLTGELEVQGPEIETPEISEPTNKFVRELNWDKVPYAIDYAYAVLRFDEKEKKWKSVYTEKASESNGLKFSSEWPGGKYRVNVRAQAPLRKSSKVANVAFEVIDGDRSAAAEYRAMLRKSIVRTTGWFVTASYLASSTQYEGVNADNGGSTPLRVNLPNNLSGTGRVGLGWLSDQSPWGFLSVADVSGMKIAGQSPTFNTFEVNGVYRMLVGQTGEFRQQFGVFYKEVPEIIALNLMSIDRIDKIAAAGPHYGVEYWMAMNPKFGLQINAHLYASSLSIKTPTGNPVTQSLSYQVGLLGSYRLSERATGLVGYAYRNDSQSYKSSGENTNSVKITGHYLNLFVEWAL